MHRNAHDTLKSINNTTPRAERRRPIDGETTQYDTVSAAEMKRYKGKQQRNGSKRQGKHSVHQTPDLRRLDADLVMSGEMR